MYTLLRSIPIPRISLDRIVSYLKYVCEKGSATCAELKDNKLDFGRGIGDITRFLRSLGLVEVEQERVRIADERVCKLIKSVKTAKLLLHSILYTRLLQYKVALDILRECRCMKLDEFHSKINEKLAEYSPNTWLNNVTFKTVVGFLEDLGFARRQGSQIVYTERGVDLVKQCLEANSQKIGTTVLVDVENVARCLELDVETVLRLLEGSISPYKAPGGKLYAKLLVDLNELVKRVVEASLR